MAVFLAIFTFLLFMFGLFWAWLKLADDDIVACNHCGHYSPKSSANGSPCINCRVEKRIKRNYKLRL